MASNTMTDIEVLRRAALLRGLSDAHLQQLLAASTIVQYQQNELVFEEQSAGRELYIILTGHVSVTVDPARLGTVDQGAVDLRMIHLLGPGEAFGEVGFLTGQRRNATIIATDAATRLLVIPPQTYDTALQTQTILANVALELTRKLRYSNTRIIEDTLATSYINVLVEELATGAYECSPTNPFQHLMVIRNPESFMLCGPGRLLADLPAKEAITVACFADPLTLQALAAPGTPTGQAIFSALFSIIRSGAISERVDDRALTVALDAPNERRRGTLTVERTVDDQRACFTIGWQLKGVRFDAASRTASAFLFAQIWTDERQATHTRAGQLVADIAMPVQHAMLAALQHRALQLPKTRVLVIHHRSHEVARTLQTLQSLGFVIDTFIGIPYGEIGWDAITMLEHASGGNYLSLRQITHPIEPIRYAFDFRQSSFLDRESEQALNALYDQPALAGDYLSAMQALAEHRLVRALQHCWERGERLAIYEDGGYLVTRIDALYDDSSHPAHLLVRRAVDEGLIAGVIEVTVAGERKHVELIARRSGVALLPVLSNARSAIKAIYEAVGVSEAVIHAAATAFGRLGLPTFQARRVVVLGGNGAVGTRLIEQLALLHNSTANIFAVDVVPQPYALTIDPTHSPHAANRLAYRPLPRYLVSDTCLPIICDHPLSAPTLQPDWRALAAAILAQLDESSSDAEIALTNSFPLAPDAHVQLWRAVTEQSGYQLADQETLLNHGGRRYRLRRGERTCVVALLAAGSVLTFADCTRPIRSGATTVIGSTGYPVLSARHLDAFWTRPNPPQQVDSLALISASSKDYEFRQVIDLLDMLLRLQSSAVFAAEQRLAWFGELYAHAISFVRGNDVAPLQRLLASPLDRLAFATWRASEPALAAAIGPDTGDEDAQRQHLADYLQRALRQRVAIRKDIRPDIGTIYHLTLDGRAKQVVLLADGFVINFFARHEKGVKTEYIDPIVTMQVLGLIRLVTDAPPPGLHHLDTHLRSEDLAALWAAIDANCRPLEIHR
jgi:CRP-like cAMP-binding protein